MRIAFRCSSLAIAMSLAGAVAGPVSAQQLPFEQVVAQLKSPDASVRLSALKLLRESGYPESATPIAPLLSDPDPRIQREALQTELEVFLGAGTGRARTSLVGGGRGQMAARAFDANWGAMPAPRMPIEVVTGLLAPVRSPSAAVRTEALYALGLLGQIDDVAPDAAYKGVVEALADRLGDPETAVRLAAARASGRVFRRCPAGCGSVAVDRVGDGLIRLLGDPDESVRGAAMEGLGEIRYERAIKSLADGFAYYKRGALAFGALDTLARIGHASSAPLFRDALRSGNSSLRRAAVDGLARSGDKDAAPLLATMETSEHDASVVLAIAFWRQRSGQSQQFSRLVQALGDPGLRTQAQDYLVELGPALAPEVAGQLGAAAPDARVALLEVLGVTGRGTQAQAIEAFQKDADPRVAAAAVRALARIRSRS